MNRRLPAFISTISNSFCDFTLDFAVNKYNMYSVLFGTAVGSFIIQLIYGIITGFTITPTSIIFIIINGLSLLLGYTLYVQSLKRLPVSLTGLIESGNLFAYLFIDYFCGFLEINAWFIFLFLCFTAIISLSCVVAITCRQSGTVSLSPAKEWYLATFIPCGISLKIASTSNVMELAFPCIRCPA